jgi:hypothetical protein
MLLWVNVFAYDPFDSCNLGIYDLACSSVTATAFPVNSQHKVYINNNSGFDVALTTSATTGVGCRYTISNGTSLNYPLETNGQIYAISIGSGTATIQLMFAE